MQYKTETKLEFNLLSFVSIKNHNWEMYCLLLTAFYDTLNNNFWNFRFGQISHTIYTFFFWGGGGWGRVIGGGKRENNAYCLVA